MIGIPTYESASYIRAVLDELPPRDGLRLAVVVVDDASGDATGDIVRRLADEDDRIVFERNPERLGLVGNWCRVFELAAERFPNARYFAWWSDHDEHQPDWLVSLVAALESAPRAVLAYPHNKRVDESGHVVQDPWDFDTRGVERGWRRAVRAARGMPAGDMVYGLFRVDALTRAKALPPYLLPDRLLLLRVALLGQFVQVDDTLWTRRVLGTFSVARQRRTLFARSRTVDIFPWPLQHAAGLALWCEAPGVPAGRLLLAIVVLPFSLRHWTMSWWARLRLR